MGVCDDAGKFAVEADPAPFLAFLLRPTGRTDLTFRGWLNPETPPNTTRRVADLMALLDDPQKPELPWLLGIELESRADPLKLSASLETTGNFTARPRPEQGLPGSAG